MSGTSLLKRIPIPPPVRRFWTWLGPINKVKFLWSLATSGTVTSIIGDAADFLWGMHPVLRWTILVSFGLLLWAGILAITRWIQQRSWVTAERAGESAPSHFADPDTELGTAVLLIAWQSAWGKWYSSQLLARQGKVDEFGQPFVVQAARSRVLEALMEGKLRAYGRSPDGKDYEPIPNTDWRLGSLHVERNNASLWRVVVVPRTDADSTRISRLLNYDSIIVESRAVEKLWPAEDPVADAERRLYLEQAAQAGGDPAVIARLSK
jgi:hypothetical protein